MPSSREKRAEEQQALQVKRDMKAFLKSQNKNALIGMIFEQLDLFQDLQSVSKQLLEENTALKSKYEPLTPEEKV